MILTDKAYKNSKQKKVLKYIYAKLNQITEPHFWNLSALRTVIIAVLPDVKKFLYFAGFNANVDWKIFLYDGIWNVSVYVLTCAKLQNILIIITYQKRVIKKFGEFFISMNIEEGRVALSYTT